MEWGPKELYPRPIIVKAGNYGSWRNKGVQSERRGGGMRGFIKIKKERVGGELCERQQHTGADSIAETTVNIMARLVPER